ncbi:MAG: 2-amino-4-hydroxy-6-hydroxymethyldihydropteridine diphosphokinase [Gammaproteobacteria bacterium]|nr:2-amino-4-hydroxy-6-hydroxymethyldihydropteridine diphosphokinase [Gammaproteobacteria bacterium]
MSKVYVSLGSNMDRLANIEKSVMALREVFGELKLSPVYSSAAVGFDGDDFLNLVVGLESALTVQQVVAKLRGIEDGLGRDRSQPRYSSRPIDLDILMFDDLILDEDGIQIPRNEITRRAFVLKPLQDLIPDQRHPQCGRRFVELWQDMVPDVPRLDVVELPQLCNIDANVCTS